MNETLILHRLRNIVVDTLGITAPLAPDTDLLGDLALDSVQQLELVVEIENEFEICFEPEDELGLATVGELVTVVARRLAERDAIDA